MVCRFMHPGKARQDKGLADLPDIPDSLHGSRAWISRDSILRATATARADGPDQLAVRNDRDAALRGNRSRMVRERHKSDIPGSELIGEGLACLAIQRG